ncbi:MAG: hypothetical protein M3378_07040 [Actinomycetota bacterium]|nr:hypothetical protein [Actinomycetota bacterium]
MPLRSRRRTLLAALTGLAVLTAACGSSDAPDVGGGEGSERDPGLVAQVASYDVVAGRGGRFIVGMLAADKTKLVSFGTAELAFSFLGTRQQRLERPEPGPTVTASFLPLPGQRLDPAAPGPRYVEGSEGAGVYAAPDVRFDRAGVWEVRATATLDGRRQSATSAFEVLADSPVPAVGDPAPRTQNPLPGAADTDPRAIDSRAGPAEPVPDPELHSTTVAAAIAARRPLMVVVSTPTYCQSRFCGPITDAVSALAKRYGSQMAFVHLEVWRDFEKGQVNEAAKEWIFPPGTADAQEPWVFVVNRAGVITQRFDNVAGEAEMDQAVQVVLGPGG